MSLTRVDVGPFLAQLYEEFPMLFTDGGLLPRNEM